MSRTTSPGSGTPYGLARVCRVWRTSRATIYRHRSPPPTNPPARRGPSGPMPDASYPVKLRFTYRKIRQLHASHASSFTPSVWLGRAGHPLR